MYVCKQFGSITTTHAFFSLQTPVGANATFLADNIIGTQVLPIRINILGGTFSAQINGQQAGVSGAFQGAIAPVNQVTLLNAPPGTVYYNGAVIYNLGGGEEPEQPPVTPPVIPPETIIDEVIVDSSTSYASDMQNPLIQIKQDYNSNPLFPQDFFPFDAMNIEFGGFQMYVYCSEGQVYVVPLDSQGNPIKQKQRIIRAKPQLIDLSKYRFGDLYNFTIQPYLTK
ncbi:MAG: hypothetical protein AB1472_03755 [Candidatus Omnitrophota bacterium]